MDETLLDDNHQICEKNIKAIEKARNEYGIKFVIATGRGYGAVTRELETLCLFDKKNEYTISYNGCAITENKNNRLLSFQGLDFSYLKEIFTLGKKFDVCMHINTIDTLYVYNINEDERRRMEGQGVDFTLLQDDNIDFLSTHKIAKILYQNKDMKYLTSLIPILHKKGITSDKVAISFSSGRYIEFNCVGVDKGEGLKALIDRLGIDIKDTIAVGDNCNDASMLRIAGLSVAAGNAISDIKELCDYTTTADNNEGVVAELLERFVFHCEL